MWASTRDLEDELNNTDPELRKQALQAPVERKGESALETLLQALDDPDD
ncbi:MAG: hypothetical protein ACRER2_14930 [Methylococcales bacterium]